MCDSAALLDGGRLVKTGPAKDVIKTYKALLEKNE
jgi:ABC-type polysaccharide/polyol phosphate transport system ATPase subunit